MAIRDGLCAIVPLSTKPPRQRENYSVEMILDPPLPDPFGAALMWAKCDMVATVSFARLDLFRTRRDQTGKRRYVIRRVDAATLEDIRRAVRAGLGI
jgi:mRNA interferase MazF